MHLQSLQKDFLASTELTHSVHTCRPFKESTIENFFLLSHMSVLSAHIFH